MSVVDKSNGEYVKKIIFVLFGLIVVFIISKWLKIGYILGFAEEGITFYDPGRTVNIFKSFWLDDGLGQSTAFYFPRLPFYLLMKTFVVVFLKNWIAQNVVFGILLLLALIYVFKLVGLFQKNLVLQWSASLFYLLNLYSISQIFNRFIILFIFLWSLLPIFLYYWIKWISKGEVTNLILFQLFSLLYSYVYGLPSSVFVLWVPSFLYVAYIFVCKKDKSLIKRSVFGLLLWILCSLWWIYPYWSLRNNDYSNMLDSNANFTSLVEVNKYYDNWDVLNLTQKYYFNREGYFKTFYSQKIVNVSSKIVMLFLVFGAAVSLLRKKNIFFVLALIVGWFVSKGVNPPFGYEFYSFMFKNFSVFQVLRNPYEKFGVVFVLAYSVLASYGIYSFFTYIFKKKWGTLLSFLAVCVLCLIIGKPILTGEVFYGYYYVKVPEYYEKTNLLIRNEGSGKILHLPFRSVPNVKYAWNFQGEDITAFLFDNPSISGINSFKREYDYFSKMQAFFSNSNFPNLLNVLNVDFIVVHKDFIQDASYWGDPYSVVEDLGMWKNTSFLSEKGDLMVYKLDNFKNTGEVDLFGNIKRVKSLDDAFKSIVSEDFNYKNDVVYVEDQNKNAALTFSEEITKPEYEATRLESGRYKVNVKNAKTPYILVLDNSFNNNWIASSGEQVFEKKFVANGYANGWLIDKKGDYAIDVAFKVWPWD